MANVRAAVLVKPKTLEAREFARPAIGRDDAPRSGAGRAAGDLAALDVTARGARSPRR